MKRRSSNWTKAAEALRVKGASYREMAEALGLPVGTVKAWASRKKRAMQPGMQPGATKGKAAEMQPGMQPAKLATFRGITALDLPGRTRAEQSLNFAALKRGAYPPRSAGIPGYLEGKELVEALQKWCAKWKKGGKV